MILSYSVFVRLVIMSLFIHDFSNLSVCFFFPLLVVFLASPISYFLFRTVHNNDSFNNDHLYLRWFSVFKVDFSRLERQPPPCLLCPLALHTTHFHREPGAKPLVDDLLLGQGVLHSRAAPSLRSI